MKKKGLLILALAGVLALTGGCGKKETTESAGEESSTLSDAKLIKLGNYKGVEIEAISTEVTDEEMQEQIDSLLAAYPEVRPVEGKTIVEEGDTVDIDYAGYKDDVAFDGGTAEGYELTIGSNTFIDGFEDGLIGKEVGETCELNLTFPESYGNADLAGQDVVFVVTINQIVEYVDAEWNDAFVQSNTAYETTDAYIEATRAEWQAYKEEQAPYTRMQYALQAVIADSEFECGNALEELKISMRAEYEDAAAQYGLDLETYLDYMYGSTLEDFEAELESVADYQLKGPLVIEAIIEAENMTLTEEEYTEGLAELAEEYQAESAEAFEEQYGREMIEESLLYNKVMEMIADQAVEV